MRRWAILLLIFLVFPHVTITAQDNRFSDDDLGIAFDLPEDWEVRTAVDTLTAGSPDALAALDAGETPDTLAIRILTGAFLDLNLNNASELPQQLISLVPLGVTAPEPSAVTYGNVEGWETEYELTDSNLTTRVALLSLEGGRVALVRALSSVAGWAEASAEFENIAATFEFTLPATLADPLANLPDNDGGVLWQFQRPQPDGAAEVTLGGLAFDPFNLVYVAAGARGVLVLDQTNGAFFNYLGPWFDDDNFADLAIPPDAKIYLANPTTGDNNQIMIVNRAGSFEFGFGSLGDGPGQFAPGMPQTIAVTRNSEIWTISEGHSEGAARRLYRFDRLGNVLANIDIASINPDLTNIKMDNDLSTGGLYLIGETGGLNLLDGDGNPQVTNLGLAVFNVATPIDVAIAPGGNIIIATENEGFLQFAPSGALLDRFGLPYSDTRTDPFLPGETLRPAGLMVDITGLVYWAETNPANTNSQVQVFQFSGDGNLPLPNRPQSEVSTVEAAPLDPATGGGPIAYGMVVQGNLNNQFGEHDWTFEGAAGDVIRITMRDISAEDTLDPQLVLIDPNLLEIANVDDVGAAAPEGFASNDAVIEIELVSFGFYTIEATRFGGRGEYELTLERIGGP